MDEQIKRINFIISILEEEQNKLQLLSSGVKEDTVELKILSLINKLKTVLWRLSQNSMDITQAEKLTNNVVVDTNKICDNCILENAIHTI